jgi:nucleotide-binding universal stress UspA family protein
VQALSHKAAQGLQPIRSFGLIESTARLFAPLLRITWLQKNSREPQAGQCGGMVRMHLQVTDAEPAEAVMQTLDQKRTDLVVMGTHGHSGFKSWMLGSVTESVLHRSKVPVFVIRQKMDDFIDTTRPEAKPNIRHILCPCNSTAAASQALQVAGAIAGRLNAHLTVLRTLDSAAETDAEELTSWIRKTADVSLDFEDTLVTD